MIFGAPKTKPPVVTWSRVKMTDLDESHVIEHKTEIDVQQTEYVRVERAVVERLLISIANRRDHRRSASDKRREEVALGR